MRTQIRGTQDRADGRNGRVRVMFHNGEDITEFVSRMSRVVTPMGCGAVAAHEAKPRDCSAFLSRPAWITTGVFKVTGLTETPRHAQTGYDVFLSGPTWLRTGVYELAALTKRPTLTGMPGRYHAFLSAPTWLNTGAFALTGQEMGTTAANWGRYGAFLSLPSWIKTGVFELGKPWDNSKVPLVLKVFDGRWITTGAFEPVTPPEPLQQSLRIAA